MTEFPDHCYYYLYICSVFVVVRVWNDTGMSFGNFPRLGSLLIVVSSLNSTVLKLFRRVQRHLCRMVVSPDGLNLIPFGKAGCRCRRKMCTSVASQQTWNRHCSSNYFGLLFTEWRDFLAVSTEKLSYCTRVNISGQIISYFFLFSGPLSSLEGVAHVNSFAERSHTCGELRKSDVGRKVKLSGWVQFQRLNKFVLLRDAYGVTQLVVPDEVCNWRLIVLSNVGVTFTFLAHTCSLQRLELVNKIRDAPLESVVSAGGKVAARPPGQENTVLWLCLSE